MGMGQYWKTVLEVLEKHMDDSEINIAPHDKMLAHWYLLNNFSKHTFL